MDNNQPAPNLNQTPPPDPNQPMGPINLPPASQTPISPNQEPKKPLNKYALLAIGAGGFLLLLVIVATIAAITTKKPTAKKDTNQAQDTKSPDELKTVAAKDIYINKIKHDLSITTPHGWGTQQNNNVIAGIYPWEGAKFLTSFRFRDAQFSINARTTSANNYVALQDVTDWVATSNNNYPLTTFSKRTNFDILGSLSKADTASPDIMAKIINPRLSSESAGRVRPAIVKSSNGSLNGVAYLTVPGSSTVYAPHMILLMTATVNERLVYLYGDIAFTDALKTKLDKEEAESDPNYSKDNAQAFNDFKAGKLTPELEKFYNQSIAAFRSIKIERTNTDDLIN